MVYIGGNITGVFQTKITTKNEIGETVSTWTDAIQHKGWLDFQSGEKKYSTFNAKIEESTHVFVCGYHPGVYALADEDARMLIKGVIYDVLLIDNPMEMNEQLEVYLRKVGAYNG